jgi:Fe-S-cluster-containing dehydrogenase component
VQCGQCVDACDQTQADNPAGSLLHWVHETRAESEAALNGSTARTIQISILRDAPAKTEQPES